MIVALKVKISQIKWDDSVSTVNLYYYLQYHDIMASIAVNFNFFANVTTQDLIDDLEWSPGEVKIAKKLLQSELQTYKLKNIDETREIQTIWAQVDILSGDRRVDFLVFTPSILYVIEVKGHLSRDNLDMPWNTNNGKNAWKQCAEYVTGIAEIISGHLRVVGVVVFPDLDVSDDLKDEVEQYATDKFGIHSYFSRELNRMSFDSIFSEISSNYTNLQSSENNMLCAYKKLIPDVFVSEGSECSKNIPLEVFDHKQAQFAKNIALNGDRVIYGVAGSGKTMMLLVKAKMLAELYPKKSILVVCHNKPLRAFFEDRLGGYDIEIRTIFSWYNYVLQLWDRSNIEKLLTDEEKSHNFFDKLPIMIDRGIENNYKLPMYDFILIDEGQDLASYSFKHLKLAHKNVERNLFLVFLDNVQSIHDRAEDQFRWVDVGIDAPGRTRYLRKNYRNASLIAKHALKIANQIIEDRGEQNSEDISRTLLRTDEIARSGGLVVAKDWKRHEINYNTAGIIKDVSPDYTIMVVYDYLKSPQDLMNINSALNKLQVNRQLYFCDDIEVLPTTYNIPVYSVYRCKGLEADVIIFLHGRNDVLENSFVGNTRAREQLYDISVTD